MKGILYELPEPEDVFCGARPYREDPPLQVVADARGSSQFVSFRNRLKIDLHY